MRGYSGRASREDSSEYTATEALARCRDEGQCIVGEFRNGPASFFAGMAPSATQCAVLPSDGRAAGKPRRQTSQRRRASTGDTRQRRCVLFVDNLICSLQLLHHPLHTWMIQQRCAGTKRPQIPQSGRTGRGGAFRTKRTPSMTRSLVGTSQRLWGEANEGSRGRPSVVALMHAARRGTPLSELKYLGRSWREP